MLKFSLSSNSHRRVALVIGNSNYNKIGKLPNAEKDARVISNLFNSIGIEVHTHINLNKFDLESVFDKFIQKCNKIDSLDTIIFYFSGHGYQEGDVNYLLPIVEGPAGIDALPLQDMMDRLSKVSRRLLIFLDACRSYLDVSQVEEGLMRSRGLAMQKRPVLAGGLTNFGVGEETFISFSAAPGKPAYDGVGDSENSPYVDALSRYIEEVDLPLTVMMARVRNSVLHDTRGLQETWDSSSLKNSFFFSPSSLLFLFGNTLSLLTSFVALMPICFIFLETSIFDFAETSSYWLWFALSFLLYLLSISLFLYGVGRAYSRVRGEQSDWQVEGRFELLRWSSAGSFGAIGGVLGGIMTAAIIAIPYWSEWRSVSVTSSHPKFACDQFHWTSPNLPEGCPRLGQLLVEGSVAGVYILLLVGFFTMHFSEWLVRNRSGVAPKIGNRVRIVVGAMLGGGFAGVVVGPPITAYFGSLNRPFLEPDFVFLWSILAVSVMSFCVVNYSLETFTMTKVVKSLVGAVIGTVCALLFLAAELGVLYSAGFIQGVFEWANTGFYNYRNSVIDRYSYLLIAGLPYGIVFGLSFGVLIGLTRLFSERRVMPR